MSANEGETEAIEGVKKIHRHVPRQGDRCPPVAFFERKLRQLKNRLRTMFDEIKKMNTRY
jgi:hypothetical protein